MNSDVIDDLKQFIASTVSQQLTLHLGELKVELKEDIKSLDKKLSNKIDDLSASVAEALDAQDDATESKFKNHEKRIKRLETKTA